MSKNVLFKVDALNQRQLITFMNIFIVRTASFMTSFSTKCEARLAKISLRLMKIETALNLIETKVRSYFSFQININVHFIVKAEFSSRAKKC